MDGTKDDLISSSDLQSLYGQQQQQHRALGGGGGGHSPSQLAGAMHSVVIRPMPNMPTMNMSATAILSSIGGGGSLAGMHFQMDPPLLHNNINNNNMGSAVSVPPAEPVKRKRGRPRKYGPDGTMKASARQLQLVSAPPSRMMGSLSAGGETVGRSSAIEDPSAQKKRRGRPPGTGKKHHLSPAAAGAGSAFSGTAGTSFTPHIITASPSEDVAAKIVAFAKQSSKAAVCVLSATGSVSRAVLRHHPADASPPMSREAHHASAPYYNNNNNNHAAIYEGFYEILSLSGSYSLSQGEHSGGLSVTLCTPERNVIGGVLGGPLVAASTVQVVLGSFHLGGSRPKSSSKKAAGKQQAFSSGSLDGGQQQQAAASPTPSSGHNQQNLTPPSVTGGWPSSGMLFDTRDSSIDINSSRG